jgi:hypothetical protein
VEEISLRRLFKIRNYHLLMDDFLSLLMTTTSFGSTFNFVFCLEKCNGYDFLFCSSFWDATSCDFLPPLYVLDLSPILNVVKISNPTSMTSSVANINDSNYQKSNNVTHSKITTFELCVHSRMLCIGFSTGDLLIFDFSMFSRHRAEVSVGHKF